MNFSFEVISSALSFELEEETDEVLASYVKMGRDGPITCLLCSTKFYSYLWKQHCKEIDHKRQVVQLRSDLRLLKAQIEKMCTVLCNPVHEEIVRFNQVQSTPWKASVHSAMFEYLFDTSKGSKRPPMALMRRYEHREQMALLELAVWKSQCLSQMPYSLDYLSSEQWKNSGWKDLKPQQKNSNAMLIITSAVRQFLS
jgi:hypothetical protein